MFDQEAKGLPLDFAGWLSVCEPTDMLINIKTWSLMVFVGLRTADWLCEISILVTCTGQYWPVLVQFVPVSSRRQDTATGWPGKCLGLDEAGSLASWEGWHELNTWSRESRDTFFKLDQVGSTWMELIRSHSLQSWGGSALQRDLPKLVWKAAWLLRLAGGVLFSAEKYPAALTTAVSGLCLCAGSGPGRRNGLLPDLLEHLGF